MSDACRALHSAGRHPKPLGVYCSLSTGRLGKLLFLPYQAPISGAEDHKFQKPLNHNVVQACVFVCK